MATILHVNHEDEAQKSIQEELGEQYNWISATDAPTAIQYCAMIQPDLILMDLDLPDVDGRELTLRLKMFMPQTPILNIVSKHSTLKLPEVSIAGSDDVIVKPINIQELQHKVQTLLSKTNSLDKLSAASELLDEKVVAQFETQIAALNQANKRLASLNAVSALIGTSLDLQHLMDQILGQIHKTIEFDSATLFLLKGSLLEAAASRGLSEHQRGMNVYTKSERNSAWHVVGNKLPLIINDVQKSDFWEARPELSKVRSWLGVPLIYKDRVVGVLTLDKNEVNGFTDADARYVFTLAYQIAITVENAQLFEEWEDQATRLKLINEISQEITTILDVDNLFDALACALVDRFKYECVAILEVDESHSSLTLRASYGEIPSGLNVGDYRHSTNNSYIGEVVKSGLPVLVNEGYQEGAVMPMTGEEAKSVVVIPIFVDNQVGAVIYIDSNQPNEFSDQDLWTLSSLANQAATVIENAQLYHKLERLVEARTQRLQAIRKISQVVSQGLDVNELQAVVGRGISQIFTPFHSDDHVQVSIGLINGSKLSVRKIYKHALANGNEEQGSLSLPDAIFKVNYSSPAEEVIRQSKPIILTNVDLQSICSEIYAEESKRNNSIMIAPLVTAGKTIGIILVESQWRNAFDESDLETLETLAFQVATAIEHARLLRKTREMAIVDERTRLARDMHDGVAQNLAYLLIQVDRCLNMVDEDSKLAKQLDLVSVLLTQNMEEIRRNIFDLRPVELEGKSILEVLEKFVAEFGRRWNLRTSCTIVGEVKDVPTEVESSLYRILQETLSNIRQHANCTEVAVKLSVDDEQAITLEIVDNGQGFDLGQARNTNRRVHGGKGIGLTSMRERAENVGGHLTVKSSTGEGTRVLAWLPLHDMDLASNSTS